MRPSLEEIKKMREGKETLGAEIGVALGDNASDILNNWNEVKLLLVDNYWRSIEWGNRTKERLSQFEDRIDWYLMASEEAAMKVKDNSLDFVYIDGDHSFSACYHDIRNWIGKIKKEGVLCGHDFLSEPGVNKAVCGFVKENGLLLNAQNEDWWVIKE